MTRRKADCTPEEWECLAKKREAQRRYRERNHEKVLEAARKFRRANPDKIRAYKQARKAERRRADPAYRRHLYEKHAQYKARLRNAKKATPLFEQVLALIPAQVEARFDIASEAMIALLEGRAKTPAGAIALGRKTHYRQFSQFDKKTISLDAPLANGGSLHDLVADEIAAWGDEAEEAA